MSGETPEPVGDSESLTSPGGSARDTAAPMPGSDEDVAQAVKALSDGITEFARDTDASENEPEPFDFPPVIPAHLSSGGSARDTAATCECGAPRCERDGCQDKPTAASENEPRDGLLSVMEAAVERLRRDDLSALAAAEARCRQLTEALSTISPERLSNLAWLLDEADRRGIWWFETDGDEVQRDLRLMAARSAAAARGDGRET